MLKQQTFFLFQPQTTYSKLFMLMGKTTPCSFTATLSNTLLKMRLLNLKHLNSLHSSHCLGHHGSTISYKRSRFLHNNVTDIKDEYKAKRGLLLGSRKDCIVADFTMLTTTQLVDDWLESNTVCFTNLVIFYFILLTAYLRSLIRRHRQFIFRLQ